jgi:hypothetical protein
MRCVDWNRRMIVVCGTLVSYDTGIMTAADKVPSDTSIEAEQAYLNLLREIPLWRKAAMMDSLTKACQELAVAGIRMRYPNASNMEILMRLAALWLDREMMVRIFGWDPILEGY